MKKTSKLFIRRTVSVLWKDGQEHPGLKKTKYKTKQQ